MQAKTLQFDSATDFMPALRGKSPSSAPPAPARAEPALRNEMKSVAIFPVQPAQEAAEQPVEQEGFFEANWLFVFPLALFVLLGGCAVIMALT